MSWCDFFYPGNADKREKIIRRSQELLELMKNNFRATNDLVEIVNTHLGTSFRPIRLDEKATVKRNCDVMIERVNQIQAKVEEVDKELKEKLEPALYKRLKEQPLGSYNFSAVKFTFKALSYVSAAVLVGYLMKAGILPALTWSCASIGAGLFAFLVLGVLIDMVASVIIGAIERSNLEEALEEYDEALKHFRPDSEKYQGSIIEVKVILKYSMKKK